MNHDLFYNSILDFDSNDSINSSCSSQSFDSCGAFNHESSVDVIFNDYHSSVLDIYLQSLVSIDKIPNLDICLDGFHTCFKLVFVS